MFETKILNRWDTPRVPGALSKEIIMLRPVLLQILVIRGPYDSIWTCVLRDSFQFGKRHSAVLDLYQFFEKGQKSLDKVQFLQKELEKRMISYPVLKIIDPGLH